MHNSREKRRNVAYFKPMESPWAGQETRDPDPRHTWHRTRVPNNKTQLENEFQLKSGGGWSKRRVTNRICPEICNMSAAYLWDHDHADDNGTTMMMAMSADPLADKRQVWAAVKASGKISQRIATKTINGQKPTPKINGNKGNRSNGKYSSFTMQWLNKYYFYWVELVSSLVLF